MSVKVTSIAPNAIHLEFVGLTTYDQLVEVYKNMIETKPEYILLDGLNMMYNTQTLFDEYALSLVQKYLALNSTQFVVCVLPKDHELRVPVKENYTQLGYPHKLRFATTIQNGQMWILEQR